MRVSWILFDAGNTLIGLNYGKVIAALEQAGLRVDEPALRLAEAAARRDLDAAILASWGAGSPPRTGWIEARVWKEFWARVVALCGAAPDEAARLAGRQGAGAADGGGRVARDLELRQARPEALRQLPECRRQGAPAYFFFFFGSAAGLAAEYVPSFLSTSPVMS